MPTNYFLIAGGALSAIAALAHLGCIIFGASWYRFFGAGEKMVQLVEAGSSRPTRVTLLVAAMLLGWAAYALSGAGVIPRLPFLRLILCAITAVYLMRGLLFFLLIPHFPGNSMTFWWWSAAICLGIGLLHLFGLRQAWGVL
ncbi:MAG: hypothetical protein NT117_06380 [Gammaproteobacteria bacterium]|nr:hypothetical protein [Gammaproteobacteria bacterium]